jgi:two-component sensor histidine kinase
VKYGALSSERGLISITCTAGEGCYSILWQESGGPAITAVPERRGFGSTLSERVASLQLDAALGREWRERGLVVSLVIPAARLAA